MSDLAPAEFDWDEALTRLELAISTGEEFAVASDGAGAPHGVPAEHRERAERLLALSQQRMAEVGEEMARVDAERASLRPRSAARSCWTDDGAARRSGPGHLA